MHYDLLIVGGGINGTAIAREAALNRLSVLLVERDDLAAHTSSASTKLIHGGLRYLEYYEFALVREALKERERLLAAAPHLIHPLPFVLPHAHAVRPWWLVRLGLYLYDWIGGRISLPRSRGLRRGDAAYTVPLKDVHRGFVYSDCQVDDARLTLANAIDAAENGAEIRTHVALISAARDGEQWQARLSDGSMVAARGLVNAGGPWVTEVLKSAGGHSSSRVRLVKGSHIVVPRLFEGQHAYMLQQPDRRIVFAIAWEGQTLIGTTDIAVETAGDARITDDEIAYLCAAANRYFTAKIGPGDVASSYAGVRPLYDDGAKESKAVTRDYVLELDGDGPALLSVFGGKITTARHLAEDALERLAPAMGFAAQRVTRSRAFPGGDIADFTAFLADVRARWPFLGDARSDRMARAYGTRLYEMLAAVRSAADMGTPLGAGFTALEADWMRTREWAQSAEDCLYRRSKLGLHMTADERAAFTRWWGETADVRDVRTDAGRAR